MFIYAKKRRFEAKLMTVKRLIKLLQLYGVLSMLHATTLTQATPRARFSRWNPVWLQTRGAALTGVMLLQVPGVWKSSLSNRSIRRSIRRQNAARPETGFHRPTWWNSRNAAFTLQSNLPGMCAGLACIWLVIIILCIDLIPLGAAAGSLARALTSTNTFIHITGYY